MQSDGDLVKAVLAGQRELFAELVCRYERAVLAEALAVLRDRDGAQDIAQDAFVAAYEKLAGLKSPNAFGGWLLQIARRRALDAARRKPPPQSLDEAPAPASPCNNGHLDEASVQLLQAIAQLPDHEREAIVLCYFEDLQVKQIAEITRRPVSTVTVQLMRARDRLRQLLKGFEP
jgi:RNA polymerase sigma-70 factor (ECF subfamily)